MSHLSARLFDSTSKKVLCPHFSISTFIPLVHATITACPAIELAMHSSPILMIPHIEVKVLLKYYGTDSATLLATTYQGCWYQPINVSSLHGGQNPGSLTYGLSLIYLYILFKCPSLHATLQSPSHTAMFPWHEGSSPCKFMPLAFLGLASVL